MSRQVRSSGERQKHEVRRINCNMVACDRVYALIRVAKYTRIIYGANAMPWHYSIRFSARPMSRGSFALILSFAQTLCLVRIGTEQR